MVDGRTEAASPLPLSAVSIRDSFWSPRQETVREVTLESVYENLESTGRIDNFRIAAGEASGGFSGRYYNDSDVYKWLEAACYALHTEDDPALRERVADVVDAIEGAQADDGYLNTYFSLVESGNRWTNLHGMHELYCAGHLFEAAVAHHRATGERRLLDVARRLADHVDDVFGPDGKRGYPGHEEIELALAKLYRTTGEQRYLGLARYFLDERGREPSRFEWELDHAGEIGGHAYDHLLDEDGEYDAAHLQDHAPVTEQQTAEGHAVRAMYLYCGMADAAIETGDEELVDALERLWTNATERRSYVTGGIGSSPDGERFTDDYDLPNETSYAETCAALGSVRWNRRMLALTEEGRFGDALERTLYNALLAGVSLSGDRFFYDQPLEVNGGEHALSDRSEHRFGNERQPWFPTACCPTNVPRLLLSLGRYVYQRQTDPNELYVSLYVGSDAETSFEGVDVAVSQETKYPWSGAVTIDVDPERPIEFDLKLRVPGWCDDHAVRVDGSDAEAQRAPSPGSQVQQDAADLEDGFLTFSREWTGERVELDLEFGVERVCAHPEVRGNADRAALRRGPLVYCLEGVDHDRPLGDYVLPPDPGAEASFEEDVLDGVVTIEGDALVEDRSAWEGRLYRPCETVELDSTRFRAVPYYAWAHREPGEMRVWLRSQRAVEGGREQQR